AVIDAELGDLDAVGMQVTVYASAYIGEIFSRADNSQTGGIAGLTRSHRLHACTAQEQMKQTHDDSCPGRQAGGMPLWGSVLGKAGVACTDMREAPRPSMTRARRAVGLRPVL